MNVIRSVILGCALTASAGVSQATEFHFTGDLMSYNHIVISIRRSACGNRQATIGFSLGENDDREGGRDWYTNRNMDSRVVEQKVGAGNYLLTMTSGGNDAKGDYLSEGFTWDRFRPQPLTQWCYKNCYPTHTHTGTRYSAHVVSAVPPVPEPETYALMLGGLGMISLTARRRKKVP